MGKALDDIPWLIVLLLCATLGLAPFVPAPHIWEKLGMLIGGELRRAIDVFDLVLHAAPFALLAAKGVRTWRG
ncbi:MULTISPECIES: hypothetical protein [Sediminimonas]|uniref:hypothetical protein n=1 Tax=Sediminimonas TaxID=659427 RepID=UPI000420A06E|nr:MULTISPECIES: hypothetical protein [Sediminimonas]MDR9483963.1 RND transporter [Sediminimonas sp.]